MVKHWSWHGMLHLIFAGHHLLQDGESRGTSETNKIVSPKMMKKNYRNLKVKGMDVSFKEGQRLFIIIYLEIILKKNPNTGILFSGVLFVGKQSFALTGARHPTQVKLNSKPTSICHLSLNLWLPTINFCLKKEKKKKKWQTYNSIVAIQF